jgi:predicted RNase H-like HicB family nuclease
MGQLVEWPEVITEGKSLDDCRELLQDALQEMIAAYRRQSSVIPGNARAMDARSIALHGGS